MPSSVVWRGFALAPIAQHGLLQPAANLQRKQSGLTKSAIGEP